MRRLTTWKFFTLFCVLLMSGMDALLAAPDPALTDAEGLNVRILRHPDGSKTHFMRSPDKTIMTKKKFCPQGQLNLVTIYRMDKHGNPISCKIYDGKENELFKVAYGYRKSDGQLVEERMFDSKRRRIDRETGQEVPVQRICYTINDEGERSRPMIINLKRANDKQLMEFQRRHGISTMYESNPFIEGEQ